MSKTRRISASSFAGSAKSGSCHLMTSRVGASRLPSPVMIVPQENSRARFWFARLCLIQASRLLTKPIKRLLEAAGMGLLGLGQGLEPVGDFVKAFRTRRLGHARIHVGIFVGLARDGGLEIGVGGADRLAGRRIAHFLQIFQMAMGMTGLAFRGGAEHGGDIVIAFDVGL